jgi:quercetin dioxygenase-like cupin family protein
MSQFFASPDEYGRHTIFGNIPIRTYSGNQLQLAFVDLPADSVVEWHSHVNEQMGVVISGKVKFQIGDEEKVLGSGDMYRIPGGVRHRVTPVETPAKVIDVFTPVRDEYR